MNSMPYSNSPPMSLPRPDGGGVCEADGGGLLCISPSSHKHTQTKTPNRSY